MKRPGDSGSHLTGDFFSADGSTKYPDIGLSVFDGQPQIEWVKFREHKTPDRGRPGRRCAGGDRADAVGHGGDGCPEP